MTWFDPHHDGSVAYTSLGATDEAGPTPRPQLGDTVQLRVRVPRLPDGSSGAEDVVLRAVHDGEPFVRRARITQSDDGGDWWTSELTLVNPLTSYRFLVAGPSAPYRWLNASGPHRRDVTDGHDFKISTEQNPPTWVADQIGYQIFPDRFSRSPGVGTQASDLGAVPPWAQAAAWTDEVFRSGPEAATQFFGGSLDGIISRLDSISELGATLLYLTPFFPANSNHRYDATSFAGVDPLLGGDAALTRLVKAAHERGIRLIGDLTTNHTGETHDWFLSAQRDPASAERGFFHFHAHGGHASWMDLPGLPKLDHRSAELARRLYDGPNSVMARWLERGLDGWRVDSANVTGRLNDSDLAHQVASTMRRTMEATRPDSWLLAEHGHDASSDLMGPGWHGTMDYNGFTRPVWAWLNGGAPKGRGIAHGLDWLGLPIPMPVLPGQAIATTMRDVHASMPWSSWISSTLHLDTHDTPRFRTVAGGGTSGWIDSDGEGLDRHLVGMAMQMTMPGVPMVYAGDEIGLTGLTGEHSRTPYPWGRRADWDIFTLSTYREWIELRKLNVALRHGSMRWINVAADSLTYLREHPEQTLLVHVVRSPTTKTVLPGSPLTSRGRFYGLEMIAATGTGRRSAYSGKDDRITLPGHGPCAYVFQFVQ